MKLIYRFILYFVSNALALWVTGQFLKQGFSVTSDTRQFLFLALVFTLLNLFLRPIFKFFLSPIIILTLGLGSVAVNMLMLYLLARLLPQDITIAGLLPLFYATLIVGLVNVVTHLLGKGLIPKN